MKADRNGKLLLQFWREKMLQEEANREILEMYESHFESLKGRALTDTSIYKEHLRRFEIPQTWKIKLSSDIDPKTAKALEYSPLMRVLTGTIFRDYDIRLSDHWKKHPEEDVEIEVAIENDVKKTVLHKLSLDELINYSVEAMLFQMKLALMIKFTIEANNESGKAGLDWLRANYLMNHIDLMQEINEKVEKVRKKAAKTQKEK